MTTRKLTGGAVVLALFALGCADAAGPVDGFDAEDAAFVALDTDAAAGGMVFDLVGVGPALRAGRGEEGDFSRVRDCPDGGTISLEGSATRTENGEGIVTWTLAANGAWDDCTHTRARGDRAVTTTIDGRFQLSAERRHDGRVPVGNQTMSKSGSFTWTRTRGDESRTGTCEFDVTSVRNPDARQIRVSGTVCGREIDRTIEWREGR